MGLLDIKLLLFFLLSCRPRLTNKEAKKKWNLKAGVTVAMMLYANSHQIYKFWPAVVGIEMRREKSSLKMFDLFHRIGLSQNIHAVRAHVDNLSKVHYDEEIDWKHVFKASFSFRYFIETKYITFVLTIFLIF